ncbi:MAG: hypothetical protein H0W72_09450 [Planctomycetes bacterium]|nr:hypothetical protein [Planctomycetota bacterium]
MRLSQLRLHGSWRAALSVLIATVCSSAAWGETIAGERLPDDARLLADRAKNARTPATLDPAGDTWRAQSIAVAEALPEPLPVSTRREFRGEFVLAAEPVSAELCVSTAPMFALHINGTLAKSERGSMNMGKMVYHYRDLQGLMRRGRNTILIEAEITAWNGPVRAMVLEGMARDATGLTSHIVTDDTWEARYRTGDGPDADDAWRPAQVLGTAWDINHPQPPYFGRIDLAYPGRKCPIFDVETPVAYELTIYAPDLAEPFAIAVKVVDALDGGRVVHEEAITGEVAPGVHRASLAWKAPKPGVYDVEVSLRGRSGAFLDRRVMETAVVGAISQVEIDGKDFTDGLDLRLVEQIDCTDPADPHPFISRNRSGEPTRSRIIDAPFGRYRACGEGYSYLAWKVEVEHPAMPHLLEIDYPDDATRLINISVGANCEVEGDIPNDVGGRLWNKAGSGVYTGFEHPVSNTMKTLRLVYWPGERVGGITVTTEHAEPAAVARIRVHEITNGLPALRRPFPAQRWTGRHTERLSLLASTFYAGEDGAAFTEHLRMWPHHGFYRNWYQANANMIRSMRFVGENLVVAGVHMYSGNYPPAEYPSTSAAYAGGFAARADPLELMARMLAKNGLSVYMGVEYASPPELYSTGFSPSDAEVAAGARTLRFVDRDGRQAPVSFCSSLNIFAPEVEGGLHRVIGDLCDLYKDTPGILGVHIQEGESLLPSLWADHATLRGVEGMAVDDITVSQFERDTGLSVPADATGAGRFAQRDAWLNQHARERWLDWRCRRIHGINATMLARLRTANPAWILSIAMLPRTVRTGPGHSFLDGIRIQGFDPRLYDDRGFSLQYGVNPQWVRRQTDDIGLWHLGRQYNRDGEIIAAFTSGGRATARQVGGGFFEPQLRAPESGWYWQTQLQITYPMPVDRNLLDAYHATLLDATPTTVFQHWLDVNGLAGNEHLLRTFNRAFTSLPSGEYRTLSEGGFAGNLIVRTGPTGLYVINPLTTPVTATLSFAGGGTVADLATGATVPASRGVELALDAYGLAAFALVDARPSALVEGPLPADAALAYARALDVARPVVSALRARLAAGEDLGGDAGAMQRFVALGDEATAALAAGSVGRARLILDGGEWKTLSALAVDRADPQYWSLIGPFDNPGRSGFDTVLPVEAEILGGKLPRASYAVDGGRSASWRPVLGRSQGDHRGLVDFNEVFGSPPEYKLAYALARIRSERDLDGELWLGSDDSIAVWIDGAPVFRKIASRSAVPAADKVPVRLARGEHTLLIKLDNGVGGWAFYVDLRDRGGARTTGVQFLRSAAGKEAE